MLALQRVFLGNSTHHPKLMPSRLATALMLIAAPGTGKCNPPALCRPMYGVEQPLKMPQPQTNFLARTTEQNRDRVGEIFFRCPLFIYALHSTNGKWSNVTKRSPHPSNKLLNFAFSDVCAALPLVGRQPLKHATPKLQNALPPGVHIIHTIGI